MKRILEKRKGKPGNSVSTPPGNMVSTTRKHGFHPPGNNVSIQKKVNKSIKKNSSLNGERSLTEIYNEELDRAIVYIHTHTGVLLKPDKYLRIWWYNAIKIDTLHALKIMIRNFCYNEANVKIGKWDWISFFKYQAKRAGYKVAPLRALQHPEPDDDGVPEEERRRHREAAGV